MPKGTEILKEIIDLSKSNGFKREDLNIEIKRAYIYEGAMALEVDIELNFVLSPETLERYKT
ncbi:MAG: hypothetical protein Q4B78_05485, partial [Bacillota bacterium]|nr:hypothetical protein [Bacillota bacterium]